MTRIDQFESVFKAAAHVPFAFRRVEVERALVVSDLESADAALFGNRVRAFLAVLGDAVAWHQQGGGAGREVGDLLAAVEAARPDLICTYRNLHSTAWRWPFSLGEHLDVLTQATATPVLVLPRPEEDTFWSRDDLDTASVAALTDHLTGDARLVNWAVRLSAAGGRLSLCHVEDQGTFDRYLEVIGKVPDLDTETARETIAQRLLKEPRDYIRSCRQALEAEAIDLRIDELVTFGYRLEEIERLIASRQSDLLVLNTKDQDQQAMHGLAYPLAVELRATPLLML